MTKKSISTNQSIVACDVCGRTLLRGEHADVFLHGGERRTVCELCTARAMHEGWIREGVDDAATRGAGERRGARSLLGRFGRRRRDAEPAPAPAPVAIDPDVELEYDRASWDPEHYDPGAPVAPPVVVEPAPVVQAPAPPAAEPQQPAEASQQPRRDVHAVPTNAERKVARALEVFNASPHRRTVAGVARSLGAPIVAALPSATEGAIVSISVAWELSWYRYEVDLGDEAAGVRVVAQGAEMDELEPAERTANAVADDQGELHAVAVRK